MFNINAGKNLTSSTYNSFFVAYRVVRMKVDGAQIQRGTRQDRVAIAQEADLQKGHVDKVHGGKHD